MDQKFSRRKRSKPAHPWGVGCTAGKPRAPTLSVGSGGAREGEPPGEPAEAPGAEPGCDCPRGHPHSRKWFSHQAEFRKSEPGAAMVRKNRESTRNALDSMGNFESEQAAISKYDYSMNIRDQRLTFRELGAEPVFNHGSMSNALHRAHRRIEPDLIARREWELPVKYSDQET